MKKLILILAILWLGLSAFQKSVSADEISEYNKAVIGHVITNSSEIDHQALLKSEMEKLAYIMMLQMANILEKSMPYILESLTAQLRLDADKLYKCKLLEGSKIEDDC